jgi:hypothetical protein
MLQININDVMVPLEAARWQQRIAKQFEGAKYSDKVTLNVVNTFVFDRRAISQPYFRFHVFLTNGSFEDCEDVKRRLKSLKVDVEVHSF